LRETAAEAGKGSGPGGLVGHGVVPALDGGRTVYVCGTPPSCDRATELLIDLGVPTARIRVERFGPSG